MDLDGRVGKQDIDHIDELLPKTFEHQYRVDIISKEVRDRIEKTAIVK